MIDSAQPPQEIPAAISPTRVSPGVSKFLVDLKYLWLEQMLEVRTTWYGYAVFSILLPLTIVFGFARIGSGLQDPTSLLYIVSGAAVFAVANDGIYSMAIRTGSMKKDGTLTYYASLPISKIAFLMAMIFSRLLLTLPGMIIPLLFGRLVYHIDVVLSPWLVILMPLTALSLSAIGMAVGVLIDNLEIIQMVVNLLLFVLIMAAPVFMPMAALPLPLQLLAYCLPPSYAADAMRQALSNTIGVTFFSDVGILTGMTLISFVILNRWLTWRQK